MDTTVRGRGSFRRELIALLATVLVSAIALVALDEWDRRQAAAALAQIRDESLATLRLAKSVSNAYGLDVVDTTFRVRNGLIRWEEGVALVQDARARVADDWPALRELAGDGEHAALIAELERVRRDAEATAAELEGHLQAQDIVALADFADRRLYPGIDPVTLRLRALVRDEEARADRLVREAGARDRRVATYRWAGTAIVLLGLALAGWRMLRSVDRAVRKLTRFAASIERGELEASVPRRPPGESGLVMDAMVRMRDQLAEARREMAGQLARTEQQAARLEQSESMHRALLQAAQVSVIALDQEFRVIAFNPFAEALTGYAAGELSGSRLPFLHVESEVRAAAIELADRLGPLADDPRRFFVELANAELPPREWTYVRKDGSRVPVLLSLSVLRGDAGQRIGYLGIATDLSQQKALEGKLRDSEAAAKQASLAKSNFLASMSHEIRTPLIGVTGMLEVLAHTPLNADQRSIIDVVQTSADALIQIIGDVLDFSKIEADRLVLDPQPTDVAALVRETTSHFEASASSRGLLLEARVAAGLSPAYLLDALRFRQILSNLISNALKFTESGSVIVRLEQDAAAGALRLSVADTGIGIAPEQQALLFAPFQQAEGGTTRRFGGTGLGLAISRQLARLMGGELAMESEPGRGTTMHLQLPAAPSAVPPLAAPARNAEGAGRAAPTREAARAAGRLVLLVDDHPTNRLVIARQLALAGYACDTETDGESALAAWRSGGYGLLLTDLHMPQMDGYELASAVRADEATRGLKRAPIVALTAAVTAEDIARCEAVGIDRHLAKPSTIRQLQQTLDALLGAPAASVSEPVDAAASRHVATFGAHAANERAAPCPPVIDRAALASLAGTPAQQRELLEEFLASCDDDLAALRDTLGSAPHEAQRHAHRLKGAARLVGAAALAEAAEALEQRLRAGSGASLAPLAGALTTLRAELATMR